VKGREGGREIAHSGTASQKFVVPEAAASRFHPTHKYPHKIQVRRTTLDSVRRREVYQGKHNPLLSNLVLLPTPVSLQGPSSSRRQSPARAAQAGGTHRGPLVVRNKCSLSFPTRHVKSLPCVPYRYGFVGSLTEGSLATIRLALCYIQFVSRFCPVRSLLPTLASVTTALHAANRLSPSFSVVGNFRIDSHRLQVVAAA
jgi:hypothetical protein